MRRSFALAAALAAAPLQEPPPAHVHASVTEIPLMGRRDGHRLRDLDGDGRLDLVVVERVTVPRHLIAALTGVGTMGPLVGSQPASEPAERRCIEVFRNVASGYADERRTIVPVPRGARCYALADVLPDPGLEIVFFDGRGVLAASLADGSKPVRIATLPGFFDFPDSKSLPEWRLVLRSKTPGERDSILYPVPTGYRLLRPTADSAAYEAAEEFPLLPETGVESSANRAFAVSKALPRPVLRDLDGDGLVDFFVSDPSGAPQILVYRGKPGGRFAREPEVRAAPSLRREIKGDILTFETAEATDLNGDGVCDLVVSRTEGNIGLWDTLTTSQLVYFGRRGSAGFDATPDQVVSSVGVSIVPRTIDFNGDGQLDLLVSSYRTDLLTNVKNAVLNSARVTYFLFLMDKGRYPRDPTVERHVDLDFKLLERGGVAPRAYFDGDFDGDGVRDLFAVEEEKKVRAYRGSLKPATFLERAGYSFADSPMMEAELRAQTELEIVDLDGDKRSEIVFPDIRVIRILRYEP